MPIERDAKLNRTNTPCASKQKKSKHGESRPCRIVLPAVRVSKRPTSFAWTNIVKKGETHGHHSIDYSDSALDRRATGLAIQFRLGLLAERRIRLNSLNPYHSRFKRTSVNKHASARRLFLDPSARTERRAFPSTVCNRWHASQLSALNRTFAGCQNREHGGESVDAFPTARFYNFSRSLACYKTKVAVQFDYAAKIFKF
jgi:hypothetical protein